MDRVRHDTRSDDNRDPIPNRSTGWGVSRNEAALAGAMIGYGILVVFVSPLLLGFLPLLGVGWLLRVPVASDPTDTATEVIGAATPTSPVPNPPEEIGSGAVRPISSRPSANV